MAGKKMAVAPKVQMRSHSQLSAAKGSFLHKELPAKDHSQPERSKFREALAAALSMDDSDLHRFGQQQRKSAGNSSAPDIDTDTDTAAASMPQPNPKRARMSSDVHARVQIGPDRPNNRAVTSTDDETTAQEKKVGIHHKAQRLAFIIEKRLFEVSGGVCNKQYKEKAIALLFKMKDRNDSAPRERILSGDITPKCLCAMTIDELASKELSEWRMAKSVVTKSVHKEVKESDNGVQDGVPEKCSSNTSSNLEYPANEENDLMMQEQPMIDDDVEFTENLPQVMTLLEFMQLLHSEPHSEVQFAGALQDDPSMDKDDKAFKSQSFPVANDKGAALKFQFHSDLRSQRDNFESKLDSLINKSVSIMDPVSEPKGEVIVKSPHVKVDAEKPVNGSIPESTMDCQITPDAALPRDSIWEGTIQLGGLTSPTNIVAIFKSGDKLSTNEWCRFLEIKRRVTLSVLKEFLEGLANSRNHAIMVTEICSTEGSLESGRHHPLQIIESYIADGRGVGLVKAAEGVQIYLCPQGKAAKILADHLPKEHSGSLTVTETSIIGLVVWRRPQQARCPQELGRISSSVVPRISQPPSHSSNACRSHQDVVTADGLPGFGPGVVRDTDLPEYNCVSVSNAASNATTSQTNRSQWHTSLSDSEIREMVLKYG